MTRFTPKTNSPDGRNNSKENYESSRAIEKDQSKNKKSMTPLQKNQARAEKILQNEATEQNTRRQRQIDQYIEMKMIKGHSRRC